jgi:hypothetical protein
MSHPLIVALYDSAADAARGARAVHALGVTRDRISVVARNHEQAGDLADRMDATPGADIEDSRFAGRLGELGGQLLAAIAVVMPGIGPIVTSGPLAAGLGEAAGHVAGSLASVLTAAGVPEDRADALQAAVEQGRILLAVHSTAGGAAEIRAALESAGAVEIDAAAWPESGDPELRG